MIESEKRVNDRINKEAGISGLTFLDLSVNACGEVLESKLCNLGKELGVDIIF